MSGVGPGKQPFYKQISLEMLGIDTDRFLHAIRPAYEELQWDPYDTARGGLTAPTRKRCLAEFSLRKTSNVWEATRIKAQSYVQSSNHGAYDRTTPRVYPEVAERFTQTPHVYQLLRGLANIVDNLHMSDISNLRIIFTFLRTVVDESQHQSGICALEGAPHTDGMDYIVSALVVNRVNLQLGSGESSVYSMDGRQLLKTVLQPGQGIFQDDQNLMHHITDIKQCDKHRTGIRDMLGIDVQVLDDVDSIVSRL